MPLYEYKAKKSPTEIVGGTIEAQSQSGAVGRLTDQGLFPIDVKELNSGGERLEQGDVKLGHRALIFFTREIADLLNSGVGLVKALQLIADQSSQKKLCFVARELCNRVRDGTHFSEALEHFPLVFTPLYTNVAASGEMSGQLESVMTRLANYFERNFALRQKVLGALIYPFFLLIMGTVALSVLILYVVPKLEPVFEDMGTELPFVTRVLMSFSHWSIQAWPLFLITGIFFIFIYIRTQKSEKLRAAYQANLLRLPVVGDFISARYLAEIFQSLESLIANGVSTVEALKVTMRSCDNQPYRQALQLMADEITHGTSFSSSLKHSSLFPSRIQIIMMVGEESGDISKALGKIANSYTESFEKYANMLTRFIGPLLVIGIGIGVAIIVVAMLLPILSMDISL